jgi:hypothetical protein
MDASARHDGMRGLSAPHTQRDQVCKRAVYAYLDAVDIALLFIAVCLQF